MKVFFKVAFCFGTGVGVLILFCLMADFLCGQRFLQSLTHTYTGAIVAIVIGLASVSLAIWDGQFIDDVKSTHWTRR
jgi:hypothetical protein